MAEKYTLIGESRSSDLDKLIACYKESKKNARVLYYNNPKAYYITRLVVFYREDGSFEIAHLQKTFGMSKTNILYNTQKKISSIIYSKNRFYYRVGGKSKGTMCQMMYKHIGDLASGTGLRKELEAFLHNKFSYLRFIGDDIELQHKAVNTFIIHKLYNLNDALRYFYKAPLPIIKKWRGLADGDVFRDGGDDFFAGTNRLPRNLKGWHSARERMINIENMQGWMINHAFFHDTVGMARKLDKMINCSWSIKRFMQEHDAWSREISDILFATEPNIILTIHKRYLDFAEYSGYKIFKTSKELVLEGMVQNHCVGGYTNSVNSGRSGIYHIEGHTLELRYGQDYSFRATAFEPDNKMQLRMVQFRGYKNADAPKELKDKVLAKLEEFNKLPVEPEVEVIDELKKKIKRGY